jgi:Plavaka transposase
MRRASEQRLLHKFIELSLKPLFERASAGIALKAASGTSRTCHPALFSYVADIPEASDIGCTVHTHTACAAMLLERSWHLRKSASLEMSATRSRCLGSWPPLYV